MKKMAVFIRKLTDVHIVAILMFLTIRFCKPDFFEGKYVFILMLVSIGIIPLLNYPIRLIHTAAGVLDRSAYRYISILLALAGYVICSIGLIIVKAERKFWVIDLAYFVSGIAILLLYCLAGIEVSGHSCGIAGPITIFAFLHIYPAVIIGVIIEVIVCFISMIYGYHNVPQLMAGIMIGVLSCLLPAFVLGF